MTSTPNRIRAHATGVFIGRQSAAGDQFDKCLKSVHGLCFDGDFENKNVFSEYIFDEYPKTFRDTKRRLSRATGPSVVRTEYILYRNDRG